LVYPEREPQQPVARSFCECARKLDVEGSMQRNLPAKLRQPVGR
jgi:hypothetical protein